MGLELLAPGVFLLWLGLAAVATGVLDWAFDLSWQAAAICFAILSVASVLLGRMVTRHPEEEDAGPSALNRRGHALVGRVFTLETPIVEGSGRIRVDDSLLARHRPERAGRRAGPCRAGGRRHVGGGAGVTPLSGHPARGCASDGRYLQRR